MPAAIIATPATVDDTLTNSDVYLGAIATLAAVGITDPSVVSALTLLSTASLRIGATGVQADATAKNLAVLEPVSHTDANSGALVDYEVDAGANPAVLVLSTVTPAGTIALPGVPLTPAPSVARKTAASIPMPA